MIIYKRGDLFTTTDKIIVHGCNMQYTFGSGVARLVRDNYSEAYEEYLKQPELQLGSISYAESRGKIIVNAITQQFYGRDGRRYVDYNAIRSCMQKVKELAFTTFSTSNVSIPKIGAGLGGGDWEVISSILNEDEIINKLNITVWEL